MTMLEIIDRLCSVTQLQADIIRKQTMIIEQAKIADEVRGDLRLLCQKADSELDLIEYANRPLIGSDDDERY